MRQGLPLFCVDFLEELNVDGLVRDDGLEPPALFLQLFETAQLRHFHAAVLIPPAVNRLLRNTVLDEFTRESLAIRVDRSIGSARVIDTLEWLFVLHGAPEHIRSDNGPEFIAQALQNWLAERSTKTMYITPGSPWENPYIESFNGTLRDECLNMHIFSNGRHAQEVTEQWRTEYNELRPHSSLDYQSPTEFAAHWRNSSRPTASFRCANAEPAKPSHELRISLTPAGT